MPILKKFTKIFAAQPGVFGLAAVCIVCSLLPPADFSITADTLLWRPWTVLTALFMHDGPVHLAVNMFALVLAGSYIERKLSTPVFLMIYLLGGIIINLTGALWLVIQPPGSAICGASSGIYTILGVLILIAVTEPGMVNEFSRVRIALSLIYLVGADIIPASTTAVIGHTIAIIAGMALIYLYYLPGRSASKNNYPALMLTLMASGAKLYPKQGRVVTYAAGR